MKPAQILEKTYLPIRDYALIGDMNSAALVSSHGSVDWCCFPRFDSPAVFCRILDRTKGGFFSLAPRDKYHASRAYEKDTNVLITNFAGDSGRLKLTDFMVVDGAGHGKESPHTLLRLVEGIEGTVSLEANFFPTLDFARGQTRITHGEGSILASNGKESLVLFFPPGLKMSGEALCRGGMEVRPGERHWFRLVYFKEPDPNLSKARGDAEADLRETLHYWKNWTGQCIYSGAHAELVHRSALALKLLIYEPAGSLVAAPTTSLPEEIGGVRNWDYRFSWVRDSTLTLSALMTLGYEEEARDYFRWIEKLHDKADVQILYNIDGSTHAPEVTLDHLEGYRGSRPVRTGNSAANQIQIDRHGHILNAAYYCYRKIRSPDASLWALMSGLADEICGCWQEPDHGIWEVRTEPRHFVYSKLMCWVGLDRAIKLAKEAGLQGNTDRWKKNCAEIRETILERGFNRKRKAFTQELDGDALDASALLIPLVDFLPFDDPRVISTREAIEKNLVSHGLVYRYLSEDGLPG
ncbi:MAG TPA: glycoside hydrolase family 15 protein, partial [Verrucomicrobiae bacterium]|nr:glycoside hydrolase family 15 protein [Verrucomicrobiae bacterium]